MQWMGLPSSIFGETCDTEEYLRSIDSLIYLGGGVGLQIKVAYRFFKILVFLKY